MAGGRPPKPLGWHLLTNNYRPSRHGPLPEPVALPDQNGFRPGRHGFGPAPAIAFLSLSEGAQQWDGILGCGEDWFHGLPDGITEAKARRMARGMWQRLGPELIEFWRYYFGDDYVKGTWAWRRFEDPAS
jgi:hypothetical protein